MTQQSSIRPPDFVALQDLTPDIACDLRYFSCNNFMGVPLDGYESEQMLMTRAAAEAVMAIAEGLRSTPYGLKLFDAYRPRRAVRHILRWAKSEKDNAELKTAYYPRIPKQELMARGYLVEDSAHSRGSTVDLTLIRRSTGEELDMGTPFDFFDELSWPATTDISKEQYANRMRLRKLMSDHGFVPLETEWWHFTLKDEPYPDTGFDFPIR